MFMRMSALPPICQQRAWADALQPLAGGRIVGRRHPDGPTARGALQ